MYHPLPVSYSGTGIGLIV
ncbi:hypothetical protein F383_13594 [Gossypium arboreum]|uniref:Uncharacterized protein n=1 Tax=Gossypium arboreum TaxID=29729 RepID=A0A0B0NBP1_GOSAR|nr:hypothetical protein F383_13594 [Gossypium arboreum]